MANEIAILEQQLAPLAPRFAQVLPAHLSADKLIRTVVVSVERLPKLLECDRQSLFNAAMSAAVLGLEVDGVTGQAYLIPFKGKAQLVVGYKGYNTLAARSGITITGAVVREGDEFEYELGTATFVRHRPRPGPEGRKLIAAWACAQSMSRPAVVAVMTIDELLAIKARSPGASRGDSPWNDPKVGFPAMCEKTVKRRLARSLPLNIIQYAARIDEAVDEQGAPAWISPDRGVIVEGEIIPPRDHTQPTAAQLTSPRAPQHSPAADPAPGTPDNVPQPGAGTLSLEQIAHLESMAREAAERGPDMLRVFFKGRSPAEQKYLRSIEAELKQLYPAEMPAE